MLCAVLGFGVQLVFVMWFYLLYSVCVCVIVGINWCCLEILVWFTVALGVSDVIWFGMQCVFLWEWLVLWWSLGFDLQLVSAMWFNFASQGKVRMLAILWLWCKLHVSRPILGWPCLLLFPFSLFVSCWSVFGLSYLFCWSEILFGVLASSQWILHRLSSMFCFHLFWV